MSTAIQHKQLYESVKEAVFNKHVRPLLENGGSIPSDRQLAQEFGVNVGTVAKAMHELAREGVVRRQVGSGTSVIARAAKKLAVGVYFDMCIVDAQRSLAVYGKLDEELQRALTADNCELHHYIDVRIPELLGRPLPRLEADLRSQRTGVLVVSRAREQEYPWLRQLPGPVLGFELDFGRGAVFLDLRSFAVQAVHSLLARGCRSVGLLAAVYENQAPMSPHFFGLHESFHDSLADAGMHTQPGWVYKVDELRYGGEAVEQFGYDSFRALWAQAQRPQGLIVHTDVAALGVLRAARELGVRLGEELQVVTHANVECRWPELAAVPQLAFSMKAVAQQLAALVAQVRAGEQLANVFVKPGLIEPEVGNRNTAAGEQEGVKAS